MHEVILKIRRLCVYRIASVGYLLLTKCALYLSFSNSVLLLNGEWFIWVFLVRHINE